MLLTTLLFAYDASAEPASQTISFSARLKNSSGGIVPDGYYNIAFSLYDQAASGSALWSETYYDHNGPNPSQDRRVRVSNGYFNVRLGSETPFGSSVDWTEQLWLTMNIGGTAHVGLGSIPWDGEMSPRIQLSAVPYAMNAATLNGRSADDFLQLGASTQNDTSDNASIAINKTGDGHLMHLQAAGTDIFTLSNTGSLTLGSASNQSIAIAKSATGGGRSLTLAAGAAATGSNLLGGNVVLQGGAGDGDGVSGGVIVAANATDSAQLFQIQNAAGATILNVDSATTTLSFGGVDISQSDAAESSIVADGSLSISAAGSMSLGSSQAPLTLQGSSINLESANLTLGSAGGSTTVAGDLRVGELDTADASTLTIGSSNATSILLNRDTVIDGDLQVLGNLEFESGLSVTAGAGDGQAFRVQNSAGASLFSVNATTNRVTIGQAGATDTVLVLGSKTTSADPAGVNGAMYYNAAAGKFRCHEAGSWQDCLTPLPVLAVADGGDYLDGSITNVSGLNFDLAANTKYHYKFTVRSSQDADFEGIGFGVTMPSGTIDSHWCVNTVLDNTGGKEAWQEHRSMAYCGTGDVSTTSQDVQLTGFEFISTMEGFIETGNNPGPLNLRANTSGGMSVGYIDHGFGTLQVVQ